MKAVIIADEIYPVYALITDKDELQDSEYSGRSRIDVPDELVSRYKRAKKTYLKIQEELEKLDGGGKA